MQSNLPDNFVNDTIRPRDFYYKTLRYWGFITLCVLFGAALGFVFSKFRPPIYESQALLSVSIDYVQTGRLSEIEEDKALEIVGDVILSDRVLNQVINDLNENGFQIDLAELRRICYRERKGHSWLLRVRHNDPETASLITSKWLNNAINTLNEALEKAIAAEIHKRPLDLLQNCFEAVTIEPAQAYCNNDNIQNIQIEMQNRARKFIQEKQASLGISSALSFAISQSASRPEKPVTRGGNTFILVGSLTGFVLSLFLISMNIPDQIFLMIVKERNG